MEHFFQDYLESQLIWTGLLLFAFVLVKFNYIQSIDKRYQLLRNVYLSFPLILIIKIYHLELPFSIFESKQTVLIGTQNITLAQETNTDFLAYIAFLLSFIIIFKIYAYWKSNTIKKNTRKVSDIKLINLFEQVKSELKLNHKQITLKSDISIGTPYCFGFSNFNIVIPEQILEKENTVSIRTILLHELNHIKNRDTIFLILEEFIQLLSLLNPLSYFIQNKINEYREHRCDQDVLNTKLISKQEYAKTLLEIKLKTQHGYWPIPVAQLTTQSSNLERRIKSMKKINKKDSKIKIAISSTLILSTLIFLSCENKSEAIDDEREVVDIQKAKVDFSKMSPDEIKEYKLKLATENEIVVERVQNIDLSKLSPEQLELRKEKMAWQENMRLGPPTFELKDGTEVKYGESDLVRKDGEHYYVKDKNGKEHKVVLGKNENVDDDFPVDLIVREVLPNKSNTFHLKDEDGKEHVIDLIEEQEKPATKEVAKKLIKQMKKRKIGKNGDALKLHEIKEKIADPNSNVKFGEVSNKVRELRAIEIKEQKKKKVKN